MPTILEDITFGPRNYRMSPAEASDRARQLLADFGLEADANRSAHELSGGQRRRDSTPPVALASRRVREPLLLKWGTQTHILYRLHSKQFLMGSFPPATPASRTHLNR